MLTSAGSDVKTEPYIGVIGYAKMTLTLLDTVGAKILCVWGLDRHF